MSEYQYYEFLAIDRPLTEAQIRAVGEFSSRAKITATSFINEYNWGSFRGNPDDFLKRFFDAMVYVANWGTHRFMFRVPAALLDRDRAQSLLRWRRHGATPGRGRRDPGLRFAGRRGRRMGRWQRVDGVAIAPPR